MRVVEDSVTCRLPSPLEQKRLQVRPDQPVLDVWRRCYDQGIRVVEVTNRAVVGERTEQTYRYDSQTCSGVHVVEWGSR